MNRYQKVVAVVIILWIGVGLGFAQHKSTPLLEKEVTISVTNETIPFILNEVSAQSGAVFSYSPEAINSSKRVSLTEKSKSVRHIINILLGDEVTYNVKGKYIILKKIDASSQQKAAQKVVVEGYLYDSQTGKKITQASVYSKEQKVAAISDDFGYFKIAIPATDTIAPLTVSKIGYSDTLLTSNPAVSSYVNLELNSNNESQTTHNNTLYRGFEPIPNWILNNKFLVNARNISDTLFNKFQFSLVPYVSTNKLLSGSTSTDYSVNATIGYVQSVKKLEVGGIANIVRYDASYYQFAGIANFVGGTSYGLQAAGMVNCTKNLQGIQSSGLVNVVTHDATFFQMGGIGNFVAGKFTGVQLAGKINIAQSLDGYQIAGIVNFSHKTEGLQLAGIANQSIAMNGVQVAGIINSTDSLKGVQLSLINRTKHLKGYQIGLVNFADTCEGIPFGLISIVRKGYHKLEVFADETFYLNAAFRTGVKPFHTVISTGIDPNDINNPLWNAGFGFGSCFGNEEKVVYNIDLTSLHLFKGNYTLNHNNIYKFNFSVSKKIARKTAIVLGLNFNIQVTETDSKYYTNTFSKIAPYSLTNKDLGTGINIKTWLGARVGVRFF